MYDKKIKEFKKEIRNAQNTIVSNFFENVSKIILRKCQ